MTGLTQSGAGAGPIPVLTCEIFIGPLPQNHEDHQPYAQFIPGASELCWDLMVLGVLAVAAWLMLGFPVFPADHESLPPTKSLGAVPYLLLRNLRGHLLEQTLHRHEECPLRRGPAGCLDLLWQRRSNPRHLRMAQWTLASQTWKWHAPHSPAETACGAVACFHCFKLGTNPLHPVHTVLNLATNPLLLL